jgi:geranylgeranyl reductase family protein
MRPCDAAVVGAGPAGAWAAYTLARRGARVTIFDPSHPREKPCGGGVTGRALALVADAIDVARFPHSVIRSARFLDSAGGGEVTIALESGRVGADPLRLARPESVEGRARSGQARGGPCGPNGHASLIVASRAVFDAALLEAARGAGARVAGSRVTDVTVDADGVRIDTADGTHRAGVVIGADGANSLVRRRVVQPFPRRHLSIATGFFAHGATSDEVVIELVADPAGYLWSFPRPDHLAIGMCAQADAGISPAALRDQARDWTGRRHLADSARLEPYSWPIPSLDASAFDALDLASERWALVGDAAGLVDPITREGIYFALLSGQWAADAVADGRFPRDYIARIRDEIAPDLACAARFKVGFFRPAFMKLLVHALQRSAAVREILVDLVAGRQSYLSLKWRLLQTLEVGLAWKMVRG